MLLKQRLQFHCGFVARKFLPELRVNWKFHHHCSTGRRQPTET
ncbi:MAG: hypothetical protein CM1200mP2_53720 [Planctomycetaceae bacterium]|nr:MAG: hypothetical protein CM1200mP2_53720 [Planctomycetaceae bacterium]